MSEETPPPEPSTLSVIMPVFNEQRTLDEIVQRVRGADILGMGLDIVLVDDCSTDDTAAIATALAAAHDEIRVLTHDRNRGKSAAVRSGLEAANGDLVIIQDADLEYDPADYAALLSPMKSGAADIVYGSRFLAPERSTFLGFTHRFGNLVLTFLSNRLTGFGLTDMSTCYKLFRRDLTSGMAFREERFGFCPEFTAKAARLRPKPRLVEVPIGYTCRTYEEGKKIDWRHGVRAIYCIFRYGLFR